MKVLVTGGAGFIGSHLVEALTARGDELVVIDDLSSGRRENIAAALDAGAELVEADVTDAEAVAGAFKRHRPELVFHLAAQIDVRRSVADPAYDLGVNVGGTLGLLEQSRVHGVRRFLFASTGGAIYGDGGDEELPFGEEAECRPDAPYGQSKFAAEGYLSLYRRLHGLDTVALRLGNVYGPRQDPHGEAGVVAIFTGAQLAGRRPTVFGDGSQTRDYVYAGDVASAFVAASEYEGGGTFNVGTGKETSVLELGAEIARATDTEFDPELAPARVGETQRSAIDPALAARELGWAPAHDLPTGLRLTADSFR
jgi:UDP-glucose 4-epimerase